MQTSIPSIIQAQGGRRPLGDNSLRRFISHLLITFVPHLRLLADPG
jgi:hypothetical protein